MTAANFSIKPDLLSYASEAAVCKLKRSILRVSERRARAMAAAATRTTALETRDDAAAKERLGSSSESDTPARDDDV